LPKRNSVEISCVRSFCSSPSILSRSCALRSVPPITALLPSVQSACCPRCRWFSLPSLSFPFLSFPSLPFPTARTESESQTGRDEREEQRGEERTDRDRRKGGRRREAQSEAGKRAFQVDTHSSWLTFAPLVFRIALKDSAALQLLAFPFAVHQQSSRFDRTRRRRH
jgi:hypothetical protein